MLETNENNFSDKKDCVNLNTETKVDCIRKEIKDNAIRIIYVQINPLKWHAEKLKREFNYELKKTNDAKLDQK